MRFRQIAHELESEAVKRKAGDEAWYKQQELLQEAEEQRRKILLEEENKLMAQRVRYQQPLHNSDADFLLQNVFI